MERKDKMCAWCQFVSSSLVHFHAGKGSECGWRLVLPLFLSFFTNVRVRLLVFWLLSVTFSSLHCHCHYIGIVSTFTDDGIGGRLALAFVVRKVLGRSEDGWTRLAWWLVSQASKHSEGVLVESRASIQRYYLVLFHSLIVLHVSKDDLTDCY